MSVTELNIQNMAASHLRAEKVITLNTGNTGPEFALWYDIARQKCIRDFDWSFARAQAVLTLHADDPVGLWTYRYEYPSDCLIGRCIYNPNGKLEPPLEWTILLSDDKSEKTILADWTDAELVYSVDVANPTLFTPEFSIALSYMLGHYVAMALTGKWSIKTDMLKIYQSIIVQAHDTDANEGFDNNETRDASWIEDRQ